MNRRQFLGLGQLLVCREGLTFTGGRLHSKRTRQRCCLVPPRQRHSDLGTSVSGSRMNLVYRPTGIRVTRFPTPQLLLLSIPSGAPPPTIHTKWETIDWSPQSQTTDTFR